MKKINWLSIGKIIIEWKNQFIVIIKKNFDLEKVEEIFNFQVL